MHTFERQVIHEHYTETMLSVHSSTAAVVHTVRKNNCCSTSNLYYYHRLLLLALFLPCNNLSAGNVRERDPTKDPNLLEEEERESEGCLEEDLHWKLLLLFLLPRPAPPTIASRPSCMSSLNPNIAPSSCLSFTSIVSIVDRRPSTACCESCCVAAACCMRSMCRARPIGIQS